MVQFLKPRSERFQLQAPVGRRALRRIVLGLTSALALSWPAGVSAVPAPDPYAACRERFAEQPDDYESAYCFYQITLDERRWDEGARVFDELIAAHPANVWLPLAYGHVYRTRDPTRAERLYRQAADGFRASGASRRRVACAQQPPGLPVSARSRRRGGARGGARGGDRRRVDDPLLEGAGVEPAGAAHPRARAAISATRSAC